MCSSSPKMPRQRPIEPQKPAQESMQGASDDTARQQMLRRGIMSTFSEDRGYQTASPDNPGAQKATTLG